MLILSDVIGSVFSGVGYGVLAFFAYCLRQRMQMKLAPQKKRRRI